MIRKEAVIGPCRLLLGDCLEVLRLMPDNSVDSVVTDPPYGLSFMGKRWDYDVPSVEIWAECLRVLKPGGHLLAFAGTRTQHRMAVRIEDAGFEIRDMIAWLYGSGFPKSLDVSKAIDKAAGAERDVVGLKDNKCMAPGTIACKGLNVDVSGDPITAPATDAARQWQGWGTALKPALEPITVARKPLAGTVAENVLAWGTGGINVDGCRINPGDAVPGGGGLKGGAASRHEGWKRQSHLNNEATTPHTAGRWPANLIHDGSDEVLVGFPESKGQQGSVRGTEPSKTGDANCYGEYGRVPFASRNDSGSAARFFYCAKASKRDRDEGNTHPTVKPTDLMRYLCRLVTPPGGTVLDPFMGSGSTGKAARLEGFEFIGIELNEDYFAIASARCDTKAEVVKEPRRKKRIKDDADLFAAVG